MRAWRVCLALFGLGCARVGDGAPESQARPKPAPGLIEQEPLEREPAPEGEPASETAKGFEPATRGQGKCMVSVVALLEAQEYRGPGPITPALEASLAADPDFARSWQSESHGDHHIQCHYAVELAHLPGKRFAWRVVHSNTLREHTAETCNDRAVEVADDIISTTKGCTDLDAGAYWGYVLEPLAQP